jgi:poly(A) polymerase
LPAGVSRILMARTPPGNPPLKTHDSDAQLAFAHRVVRELRDFGYVAYWAGGCVRDRLLGRTPKDYDVATSARPEQIRQVFGQKRTLPIGAAFGVITVLGPKEAGQIEVATFRCDVGYSDGRRPDAVTFSDAREDALRRDFTINGMFFDPLTEEVLDYVGGRADLEDHHIRAIGDPFARIAEDKLRMLRAVRFGAHFGFAIEEQTLAAVRQSAAQVQVVSAERISQELRRMWTDAHRVRALELLLEAELLPQILPEIAALIGRHSVELAEGPCDVWHYLLRVVSALEEPKFSLAAAAVLHVLTIPHSSVGGASPEHEAARQAEGIGRRWRLSKQEIDEIRWLVRHQATWQDATTMPWPKLQRQLVAPLATDWLQLAHAMALTGRGSLDDVAYCREKLQLPVETLNPPPLVNGHDLAELGLVEGPRVAGALEAIRDAQLLGEISTRDEALEFAKKRLC